MSKALTREDILNAFMNPVISRQVTQIIKQNTMGFVLEPILPEFAEKKSQGVRTADPRWTNKPAGALGTVSGEPGAVGDPRPNPDKAGEQQPPPSGREARPADRPPAPTGDDPQQSEPVRTSKDAKVWIVIKSGAKHGPFTSGELTVFIQGSENTQQMLIKNTAENRILTVDFYQKEYLPELERRAEAAKNGLEEARDATGPANQSEECSLDQDVAAANEAQAAPKRDAPATGERNVVIEEIPLNESKGRQPDSFDRDPRPRPNDPQDSKRFNMFTGTISGPEERSPPYGNGYRGYQDPRYGYPTEARYDYPPVQPPYPDRMDDYGPPRPGKPGYPDPMRGPNRPFDQPDAYRGYPGAPAPYKPADPKMGPKDYYGKPMPPPPGPYRMDYPEPVPTRWAGKEAPYAEPENIRVPVNRPYLGNPPPVEPVDPRPPRTDVAVQRIEDDPALDNINDPYFLISELTKRNNAMRSNLDLQEGAQPQRQGVLSGSDSVNLARPPEMSGIKSPDSSASSRNGQEHSPKDPQESSFGGPKQEQRPARDLYMQNIRSINKQTTLDLSGSFKDPQRTAPPGVPPSSQLRPAKTETLSRTGTAVESDLRHPPSATALQKDTSPVNSYMQNIMKLNKKSPESDPAPPSTSGTFPPTLPPADFRNFPPVQQSRLQEPPAFSRSDLSESLRPQAGPVAPEERREERQNKFIEQVYSAKDLRRAKEVKGEGGYALDNIFERDAITIPPEFRDNGPKPPAQQAWPNAPREDGDSMQSLPKNKAAPGEPKKGDPYAGYPAQNRPKAPQPPQQMPGYPQSGPRYPPNGPSGPGYPGFDGQRGGQGYPLSGYPKPPGTSGGYMAPPYEQGYPPSSNKYPPDYVRYREQPNYGYADYGMPQDYGKFGQAEHGFPGRPYQGKDYPQYDYEGQYDRNYPPRKPYPGDVQGFPYGQAPQRPHEQFPGYKGEPQRFNYPLQQAYQGYDDGYNPYPAQRGFNQYDAPRGPPGKYPVGNSGYPPELQGRFKGQGQVHGKNADDSSFYDRPDERGGQKQLAPKDGGYGKPASKSGNRGRGKGKKKDSDSGFYQNKQAGQSHNESGY